MDQKERLLVIWTSGDREVALKTVFMYTRNSKRNSWWDEVRLVVWGPSSRLLAGDDELKAYIREMKDAGISIDACKACSDMYGVSDALSSLGINVVYMGAPLTEYIKNGWKTLTF